MNYTELTINGETYKLRLNTRNTVALEKALGTNPLEILFQLDRDEIPKVNDLVCILHYSLQAYNHGLKLDDAFDIFDDYLATESNTIFSFVNDVIIPVYQNAGLLAKPTEEKEADEKN